MEKNTKNKFLQTAEKITELLDEEKLKIGFFNSNYILTTDQVFEECLIIRKRGLTPLFSTPLFSGGRNDL